MAIFTQRTLEKDQGNRTNPIQMEIIVPDATKHILILIERLVPNRKMLETIRNTIWSVFGKSIDMTFLSSTNFEVTEDKIKKAGIYKFYKEQGVDVAPYIRDNTLVLAMGFSISNIIKSSDLTTEDFYDFIFNKTYFFSPQIKTWVFPIDGFAELVKPENLMLKNNSRAQFFQHQLSYMKKYFHALLNDRKIDDLTLVRIRGKEQCHQFMRDHQDKTMVSWDLETTGFDFIQDRVICITMSFDGKTGYYIPWETVDIQELTEFFRGRKQLGVNLKFDVKFLINLGVDTVKIDEDALQLGQTLNEMRANGLKSLSYHYTKHGGYEYTLDCYKEDNHPKDYSFIPEKILFEYATKDAILTYQIWEKLQKQLDWQDLNFPPEKRGDWTTREFYENIKIPAVNSFVPMEIMGVYVNMEVWDKNSNILDGLIKEVKDNIRESLGIELEDTDLPDIFGDIVKKENNKDELQSSEKLGKRLQELGWKDFGRAKKGHYLTGDDQLSRWEELGYPEATLIRKMRSLLTLQKTFLGRVGTDMGWRQYIRHHPDGSTRIHPSYKSMMMNTMRNGCGNPNYQQMPSHSESSELFKQILTVPNPETDVLVSFDFSSFQMRLATIDINNNNDGLYKAYRENPDLDLHSVTGYNIFAKGKKFDIDGEFREISLAEFIKNKKKDPFATMRQDAKAPNFGMIFGVSYKKFSSSSLESGDNPWSLEKVEKFIEENHLEASVDKMADRHLDVEPKLWKYYAVANYIRTFFFESYPGLMDRIKRNEKIGKERGYIRSHHGAIRRVPLLTLGWDSETSKVRPDEDKSEFAGFVNITSNSTIQTDEVCTIEQRISTWKGLQSGTVHDSGDQYMKKTDLKEKLPQLKEHFTFKEKWGRGIIVPIDITVVDFTNPDHYYKHGYEGREIDEYLKTL